MLLLSACVTSPQSGAPVESRDGSLPAENVAQNRQELAIAERPAAVRRLIRSAEVQSGSGRYNVAASTLERALRISPKDPLVWQRLAQVRLKQGQWGLAVQMASKSNSLAVGDLDKLRSLRRDNWDIIAQAQQSQGNSRAARQARQRARALSETL
jgi:predicted Zn-dependent protease